tara:strand:+ start:493 stop:735 length:243 start_codon:yes stop_codon:yes gene_type:complete
MDKFKILLAPDSRIIKEIFANIAGMAAIIFLVFFIASCSDDTFIAGYNKDLEQIHQQMFEVDSLIMTIQKDLDSLNAKGS